MEEPQTKIRVWQARGYEVATTSIWDDKPNESEAYREGRGEGPIPMKSLYFFIE